MNKQKTTLLIICFSLLAINLLAQVDADFQLARQLMQQQKYNEAYPLLENLHSENSDNFNYAIQFIDCLIQLKNYDEALEVTDHFRSHPEHASQNNIRMAELYHYKGEKEKAINIWLSNLKEHQKQLQLYVTTARTMINRREYLKAVEVYQLARTNFQNDRLFFGDIANAYMQAGEYEPAINEWLNLLNENPAQLSYIQRSLLRFNDPVLYDITIVELEDRLNNTSASEQIYQSYYKLLVWLLQENKLFKRAMTAAREFESQTSNYNYSLFNLGRQLNDNNEFELAINAYQYYTENASGEVKWRSLEELANTYSKWAKFNKDHNLTNEFGADSLYKLANTMLDSIERETNRYSRIDNVYLKRAEIALDYVYDLQAAEEALENLKSITRMEDSPEVHYLEGRIYLAKEEFPSARISFTRSNRKAESGNLAEKSRYFLALTDFYSGDYEFSTIQLKSLGRQNTSYYANDALKLRLWLQQGLSVDTTGANLSRFADAVYKENNGKSEESAALFAGMIEDPTFRALKDDAILFYVQSSQVEKATKFIQLGNYLSNNTNTPYKERLLWEQAKLAERTDRSSLEKNCETAEDCFFNVNTTQNISASEIYEQLILFFPQGFYAPYARERLNFLKNENS